MSRVINPDSAGKQRTQLMRTTAEILRRLSQKSEIDAEVKDMVATLVFCFREIDEGIDVSATAWEKRDYWVKAEEFRQRWSWAVSGQIIAGPSRQISNGNAADGTYQFFNQAVNCSFAYRF